MSFLSQDPEYSAVYSTMDLEEIYALEKLVEAAIEVHDIYKEMAPVKKAITMHLFQEALSTGETHD